MLKNKKYLLVASTIFIAVFLVGCAKDRVMDFGNGDSIRLVGAGNDFDCDDPAHKGVKKVVKMIMEYSDGVTKRLCEVENPDNANSSGPSRIVLGFPSTDEISTPKKDGSNSHKNKRNFIAVEKQQVTFSVPEDWIDHTGIWVEPLPKRPSSQAANFRELDENKPYDLRGEINLVIKLSNLTQDEELSSMLESIKTSSKMMNLGAINIVDGPKIIKIGTLKAVSWRFTFIGRKGTSSTSENLVTTRAIYVPANGYVYKFTMSGEESQCGKLFDEVIKTIKIKKK